MNRPGPWFVSDNNPSTIINFYHQSGVGRYASQPPLTIHGGYPVLHCYDTLTAHQVSKFPEFIRCLQLVRNDDEIMSAIRDIDIRVHEVIHRVMNNFGSEDYTPRSYKMLSSPKELPINPQIGAQFRQELTRLKMDKMLALYNEFWAMHPWGERRDMW